MVRLLSKLFFTLHCSSWICFNWFKPQHRNLSKKRFILTCSTIYSSITQLWSDDKCLYLMKHDGHKDNELDASLGGGSCRSKCDSVSWKGKHVTSDFVQKNLHAPRQSRILWSMKDFAIIQANTTQNSLEDLFWLCSFTCGMNNQTKRSGDFRAGCPRRFWICTKKQTKKTQNT